MNTVGKFVSIAAAVCLLYAAGPASAGTISFRHGGGSGYVNVTGDAVSINPSPTPDATAPDWTGSNLRASSDPAPADFGDTSADRYYVLFGIKDLLTELPISSSQITTATLTVIGSWGDGDTIDCYEVTTDWQADTAGDNESDTSASYRDVDTLATWASGAFSTADFDLSSRQSFTYTTFPPGACLTETLFDTTQTIKDAYDAGHLYGWCMTNYDATDRAIRVMNPASGSYSAYVTIQFADSNTYALTVNSGTGSGTYNAGETVEIVADPAPTGQVLEEWIGDDANWIAYATAETTTIIMPPRGTTITATYRPKVNLTVHSGSGSGLYAPGEHVKIVADPAPTDQMFDLWVASTGQVADSGCATADVTMPASDVEVTATYTDVGYGIVAWGGSNSAEPPAGTGYTAVAGSWHEGVALDADGAIVTWGIGDDPPAGTGYTAIAGGDMYCMALDSDGRVVSWGSDIPGAPTETGFTAISAGEGHCMALRGDGSIVSWGSDGDGQVTHTPTGTGFVAIAAGGEHSLALDADGSIEGWGKDNHGQAYPPTGTGFTAIAGGWHHSLALDADGAVVAWGSDAYGQVSDRPTGTGFVAIAAKDHHCMALHANGTVVAWGMDYFGQVSGVPNAGGFTAIASRGYAGAIALRTGRLQLTVNSGSGSGFYEEGEQAVIVADPAPSGQMFDQWVGDSFGAISSVYLIKADVTMPAADLEITATYTEWGPMSRRVQLREGGGTGYVHTVLDDTWLELDPPDSVIHGTEAEICVVDGPVGGGGEPNRAGLVCFTDLLNKLPPSINSVSISICSAELVLYRSEGPLDTPFRIARITNPCWVPDPAGSNETDVSAIWAENSNYMFWLDWWVFSDLDYDTTTELQVNIQDDAEDSPQTYDVTGLIGDIYSTEGNYGFALIPEPDYTSPDPEYNGITFRSSEYADLGLHPTLVIDYSYSIPLCTLTVNSGSGSGTYTAGTQVEIVADAPPPDSFFDVWVGDTIPLADPDSPTTTVTMPAGDVEVTASYALIPHVLTVNSGSGSGTYTAGTEVQVMADPPPPNMIFDAWMGDVGILDDPLGSTATATIPAYDVELTAMYLPNLYMLTVNSGSGGGMRAPGETVEIVADAPPPDSFFDVWVGDTVPLADPGSSTTIVTMPAGDVEVTASYALIPHVLTVNSGSGSGTYTAGTQIEIVTDAPPLDSFFDVWVGDTAIIEYCPSPVSIVTMPASDTSVTATYTITSQRTDDFIATMLGGHVVLGGGSGYGDGTWYSYPLYGWYNQWYYDHPFDPDRRKTVSLQFDVDAAIPGGYLEVAVNWSMPTWPSGQSQPPLPNLLPPGSEDELVGREIVYTNSGVSETGVHVDFEIVEYNPEWVSIDIRDLSGSPGAFEISGTIVHDCLPKALYTLTVNSGTGSGSYSEATVVEITADQTDFQGWVGDTAYLDDPSQSTTNVTMPAGSVEVTASYGPPCTHPDGDISGPEGVPDGFVGQADLDAILDAWGDSVPPGDPRADISGPGGAPDGFVGQADLDVVLDDWGKSCE